MRKYNVDIDDLNSISYKIHEGFSEGEGNVHYTEEGYKQLAVAVTNSLTKALQD